MRLRVAVPDDIADLARIEAGAIQDAYRGLIPDSLLDPRDFETLRTEWETLFSGGPLPAHLVEVAGRPRGFVLLGQSPDSSEEAEIFALFIEPGYQRQGLGRRLVEVAREEARARGHRSLGLWVLETHRSAREFYEALGFILEGSSRPSPRGHDHEEAPGDRAPLGDCRYRLDLG